MHGVLVSISTRGGSLNMRRVIEEEKDGVAIFGKHTPDKTGISNNTQNETSPMCVQTRDRLCFILHQTLVWNWCVFYFSLDTFILLVRDVTYLHKRQKGFWIWICDLAFKSVLQFDCQLLLLLIRDIHYFRSMSLTPNLNLNHCERKSSPLLLYLRPLLLA